MTITVAALWVIYIVVVVIVFIITAIIVFTHKQRTVGYGSALLLASILGAIVLLIGGVWIDPTLLSASQQTWLNFLFILGFLLPIVIILYIVISGEYSYYNGWEDGRCINSC